jgi:exodeoxyribonuclease VII large subunit
VQGDEAPPQIVDAIRRLNLEPGVDLILLARGGGSLEDLWAFNDERVVRAIANSELPVITGIGHETDFTLSDFAADVRAATPTAAAEQAVPDRAELREQLVTVSSLLASAWQQRFNQERGSLVDEGRRLELQSPVWRVRNDRQRLDELQARLSARQRHRLDMLRQSATGLRKRLVSLGPAAVLKRGYAIVRSAQGELVTSVQQVQREDVLELRVTDGTIISQVLTDPTKDTNGGISDD